MALMHDQFAAAVAQIEAAAFDPALWPAALDRVAPIGGGWGAQLIGFAGDAIIFDLSSPRLAGFIPEFEARGGGDPTQNYRARVMQARADEVFGDDDFADEAQRRRLPFHQEYLVPNDAEFAALARLRPSSQFGTALAVTRGRKQGHCDRQDREDLGRLLPHLSAALRLQAALERKAGDAVLASLEALSTPALLFDGAGRVLEINEGMEEALRFARHLKLRNGRLSAVDRSADQPLKAAIDLATIRPRPFGQAHASAVRLKAAQGATRSATVAPLPEGVTGLRAGAVAILTLSASARPVEPDLLREAFQLSVAEADIAWRLTRGRRIQEIALERGVSVVTIRNQVRGLFEKTQVASLPALVAALMRASD